MLLNILLVILVLDCIALVGVVLLQRSEGGALGMGGGPTGMFTARGAGDLLTRTTWILASVFFGLSFVITLMSGFEQRRSVVDTLKPDVTAPIALPGASDQLPGQAPAPNAAPPLPGAAQAPAAPPLPGQAPAPQAAPPLPDAAPRPAAQRPASAPRPAAQRQASAPAQAAPPLPTVTQPAAPAPASSTPPTQNP